MAYTALYRKFRPDTFEEVKGQDAIVTTLKNQIKNDRIGHAYLFCGTRGTGKTTVAKILGKALNCENPVDGNPCGVCETCKAIQEGRSMNVIEVDAASNNGVDSIREIRDEVQYSPTSGKYKVYIIDEVHMLSTGAFNALLKTLEEPPSYVIFILATTEAFRIPVTILSRCQRYDFKRISIDTIASRLGDLMTREGNDVEEKALRYVAKAADGSMRDALSILDQCLAFHMNERLTYDHVLEVLGAVDADIFSKLLRKVIEKDTTGCIYLLEDMVMSGRDLTQMVLDFDWYMRNLLLVKTSSRGGMESLENVLDVSSETLKLLEEEAKMIEEETLMRFIRIFSELASSIKYATQKRVMIELALIKLTNPAMEENLEGFKQRISDLEKQVEALSKNGVSVVTVASTSEKQPENDGPLERMEPIKPSQEELQQIVDNWKKIHRQMVEDDQSDVLAYMKDYSVNVGRDQEIIIGDIEEMFIGLCDRPEAKEAINKAIEEVMGKTYDFKLTFLSKSMPPESYGLRRSPRLTQIGNIVVEEEA